MKTILSTKKVVDFILDVVLPVIYIIGFALLIILV